MRDARLAPFRTAALAFAAYLLVQAGSGAALFAMKLGGDPASVAAFYRGAEDRFVPAKTLDGLLLVAVPHLVAIPLVLFAASHVVAWSRVISARAARALVALSFGAALAGIAAPFAVRFGGEGFAWAKLAAFVALEAALVGWAALLGAVFLPGAAGARERQRERSDPGDVPARPVRAKEASS